MLVIGYDRATGSIELWAVDDGHLQQILSEDPLAFPGGHEDLEVLFIEGGMAGDPTDYKVVNGDVVLKPRVEIVARALEATGEIEITATVLEHGSGDDVSKVPLIGFVGDTVNVPIDQNAKSGSVTYTPGTDLMVQIEADRRLYRSNTVMVRV